MPPESQSDNTTAPDIISDAPTTIIADAAVDRGVTADQGDSSAAPPAAAEGDTPETLLDLTRRVLKGDGESPAPESAKTDPAAEAASPDATEGGDAEGADKDKEPPFHKHPRWQEKQREVETLRREVETFKPDAEMHRQTLGFMERNRLSPEDVRNGFAIMAAMRSDPATAYAMLEPTIRDLRAFLGHDLPADLQQRVDDGQVDETTAQETARLRNEQKFHSDRQVAARETEVAAAARDNGQATAQAVDTWVQGQQAKDLDFALVSPLLEGAIRSRQAQWAAEGKRFDTPAAAVELSEAAYRDVKAHLVKLRPRVAVPAIPSSSSAPAGVTAQPKTSRDAIMLALRG